MKIRDYIIIAFLLTLYLLFSIRYVAGNPGGTVVETLLHIVSIGPFNLGATMLICAMLKRVAGQGMPWDKAARIFLFIGIAMELLIWLFHVFGGTPVSG
ncbi:MAG: hypothetical protein OEY01_05915 [Desulfobulbaceae bacterium]|nr:hypothetical protein [Desulfobulbaceae bacterium]HIJ78646.1 hypothetical protein [Deltaproteobacteria bacterium]